MVPIGLVMENLQSSQIFDYQVCNDQKILVVKLVAIENFPSLKLW